jgi:outer membrane protein insertion porin family
VQVSFVIDDGAKSRVRKVEFGGNEVFSDGRLRRAMKKIKEASFFNFTWLTGKSTYTDEKWSDPEEGDRRRLEDHFLNRGYVTATVGEPAVSYFDGKTRSWLFKVRPIKWMKLDIPVSEGEQYKVGKVQFEGLTVFKEEDVRTLFKLKEGDVYKESRIKKGYEKLREQYGSVGYFQWQPLTLRRPDPERKVVDLTLKMEEDKRYYVGRIIFTGNELTKDKVTSPRARSGPGSRRAAGTGPPAAR